MQSGSAHTVVLMQRTIMFSKMLATTSCVLRGRRLAKTKRREALPPPNTSPVLNGLLSVIACPHATTATESPETKHRPLCAELEECYENSVRRRRTRFVELQYGRVIIQPVLSIMLDIANSLLSPTDTMLDRPAASSGEKAGENVGCCHEGAYQRCMLVISGTC